MHPRREACSSRVLSPIRILLTSPRPPALGRKERKGARAQRRKGRGPRAEIRLLGPSPCSVVGYAAKPASPTLRKTSKPLGPPSAPGLWLGGGVTARKPNGPWRKRPDSSFATLRLCVYFSETATISTGDPLPKRLIPQMQSPPKILFSSATPMPSGLRH